MIEVHLTGHEIDLLLQATATAGHMGWPPNEDSVRVNIVKQTLEKARGDINAQGWQGQRSLGNQ